MKSYQWCHEVQRLLKKWKFCLVIQAVYALMMYQAFMVQHQLKILSKKQRFIA